MIKALIFDFDGLILDTESPEFQAWQEVFAAHGHELAPSLWADLVGRPRTYFDMYAYFKALNGPLTDLDTLRKDRRARVIELVLEQPILPGVLNQLSEAKEIGLKIGLASSSGGEYVRGHLKRLGLLDYFHVTKCFEDTEAHKPDPAPYLAVLDEIGVAPPEAIAFEDSPNGVAAARAAGLFCIAVPNPITQCLSLAHADHCLKSLADEPLQQLLSRAANRNGDPYDSARRRFMKKSIFWSLLAVSLLSSFTSRALAQASLEKVRLAYSALGGSQVTFWIPYEAGIFRKHGLDVELVYIAGGGRAGQVVQSGEVPIGVFTGGAVINANLAGGDLVVVASSMNVMTFVVMTRPEIKRPEDLKGKRIGISRFGSATDFGLRYAEERWPIKRQRDFAVIQVGGVTDVYNSLRAGALDAAVVNAELAILGRREGFRELVDIAKLGINFPTSSAVTTRSFIKRNENTVRKFIRGFVEGVHFAKTHRGPAIKIMQKYLRSSDAAMFDELYEMYIVRNIPRVPRPSPESLKTVLDQMVETDPRVATLKPEQFIDGRFFRELDKEGFIEKLWK